MLKGAEKCGPAHLSIFHQMYSMKGNMYLLLVISSCQNGRKSASFTPMLVKQYLGSIVATSHLYEDLSHIQASLSSKKNTISDFGSDYCRIRSGAGIAVGLSKLPPNEKVCQTVHPGTTHSLVTGVVSRSIGFLRVPSPEIRTVKSKGYHQAADFIP